MKCLISIAGVLLIGGCAYGDGSTFVTGTTRKPVEQSIVQIYLNPPPEYEVIGLVSGSGNGWTEQESLDLAIEQLKKRAASIGANGVLLTMTGEKVSGTVGGMHGSSFYAMPVTAKTLSGQAIAVKQISP